MTREEMNLIRGFVGNIQSLKDAHINDNLPINYGMLCTIVAKGWGLLRELEDLEQESCEDAISREDALMCMTGEYLEDKEYKPEDIISKHIKRLRALPPVQPKPKTGHWIEVEKYSDGKHKIKCSECRSHIIDRGHANSYVVKEKYKYCPRCGAKMIEPQESEDKE